MGEHGRFDGLVEVAGASALAASVGFAAFRLAPLFDAAPSAAMTGTALAGFALSFAAIRMVAPEPRPYAIAEFAIEPIDPLDELLLEHRFEEPLLLEDLYQEPDQALLLEDMIEAPTPDSRVVRLFTTDAMPTPGQLKARIDRHLAGEPGPAIEPVRAPLPDASDALYAALADLKRSLR